MLSRARQDKLPLFEPPSLATTPDPLAMDKGTAARQGSQMRTKATVYSLSLRSALLIIGLLTVALIPTTASKPLWPSLPETGRLVKYAAAATAPLLRCFQVYPPVLTPSSNGQSRILTTDLATNADANIPTTGCSVTQRLVTYTFANSYGQPYSGPYTPPSDCDFNRVTFNLTATAAGRQFDRLGEIYLGDTEIWRTSTAEPTKNGIVWTYIKDMSHFKALLAKPQKLIFDLNNVVDQTYTAPINVILEATFFNQPDNTIAPADEILPISARQGASGKSSAWQVPASKASTGLTLPRNVNRAVVGLAATGQATEEFWYNNAFNSQLNTFPGVTLYGFSPFREVQLLIDGSLAGVVWPFPIIFTGGIVPGFWRPEVGIDAFDLREDEIDVTPWLGILCDGNSHTFEIKVVGINDDGSNHGSLSQSVGDYWLVSGQIFLWLDPKGTVTTGSRPRTNTGPPQISLASSIGKTRNGTNDTLTYDTKVQRVLSITSDVQSANKTRNPPSWNQTLSYANHGVFTNKGVTQYTKQNTSGLDIGTAAPYSRAIGYPITVNSTFTQDANGNTTISAVLDRGQDIIVGGVPVFPTGLQSFDALADAKNPGGGPAFQGAALHTRQNGSAYYNAPPPSKGNSSSFGSTEQLLEFDGFSNDHAAPGIPPFSGSVELYRRHVVATNGSVVSDEERLVGRQIGGRMRAQALPDDDAGIFSVQDIIMSLGRGPARRFGML